MKLHALSKKDRTLIFRVAYRLLAALEEGLESGDGVESVGEYDLTRLLEIVQVSTSKSPKGLMFRSDILGRVLTILEDTPGFNWYPDRPQATNEKDIDAWNVLRSELQDFIGDLSDDYDILKRRVSRLPSGESVLDSSKY